MTLFEYFWGFLIEQSYKRRVNEAHYILLLNYSFKSSRVLDTEKENFNI